MNSRHSLFSGYDFSTPAVIPNCLEIWYIGLDETRSLGRLGVPVYGVFTSGESETSHSRYLKKGFFVDPSSYNTDEKILEFLIGIADKVGRMSLLVVTTDASAKFSARNYDTLKNYYYLPKREPSLVEALCDKWQTHLLAEKHGVPTTKTAFPKSSEDVVEFSKKALFPVILKARDWTSPDDLRPEQTIAFSKSPEELLDKFEIITQHGKNPNVVLQEYIHGGRSQE
jgi:D-aspartate ligase